MEQHLRSALPLYAAVFIDLFSFGLMYPVIIVLFHQPAIEAMYSPAFLSVLLSLAFSLYPFGMFFGAALLGDISDAFGRRRTLLICMSGLAAAYLLMLIGVETEVLVWLLAGRLLSGLMAGTSPIAQAAMMDHSTERNRGTNMSHVVLVNCVALVSGPAAGGVLAHIDVRAPFVFAIGLCLLILAWIYSGADLREGKNRMLHLSWRRPFEVFVEAWRQPALRGLASAFFLFQFGFAIYYVYILVRMSNDYGLTPSGLGLFSGLMGVGFVVGSTLLYAQAKRYLSRDGLVAMLGLALCGGIVLAAALPLGAALQWLLAFLACSTNLLAFVGLLTLISASADAGKQGWALGISAAMVALSFFLSGLFASTLALLPLPWLIALGGLIVLAGLIPLRAAMRGVPAGFGPTAGDRLSP